MSRRQFTTATFSVKMRLPAGAKVEAARAFLVAAIARYKGEMMDTYPGLPMSSLEIHEVIITLAKRETQYLEPKGK